MRAAALRFKMYEGPRGSKHKNDDIYDRTMDKNGMLSALFSIRLPLSRFFSPRFNLKKQLATRPHTPYSCSAV